MLGWSKGGGIASVWAQIWMLTWRAACHKDGTKQDPLISSHLESWAGGQAPGPGTAQLLAVSGQLVRLCPKGVSKEEFLGVDLWYGRKQYPLGCAVREMGLWLQFWLITLTGSFVKSLKNGKILTSPSQSWAGCCGPVLSCWLTKGSACCIPIQVYSPSFLLENILYHSYRIFPVGPCCRFPLQKPLQ